MIEVTESHTAQVGAMPVRRALPRRDRRTVGAWCFVDHMGPAELEIGRGSDIGPHPHTGLQTVTWLVEGEVLHRDSLGSEQPVRPGELNLMTAGHGIAHAEEGLGARTGRAHGVQLWVAQPDATRHGASAFEHHGELPRVELGTGTATVLVGNLDGTTSPARRDTDHVGVDLDLRAGTVALPLVGTHEHALVVLSGSVRARSASDDAVVEPGHLAHLGTGLDEIELTCTEPARLILLGGTPFEARISMFWNFVARDHDEIDAAFDAWTAGDERFGRVGSALPRIPSPLPPWRRSG